MTTNIKSKYKPRSELQKLQSEYNWLVYFSCPLLSVYKLQSMNPSQYTLMLHNKREQLTKELKESIKRDYNRERERIKNKIKKGVDGFR